MSEIRYSGSIENIIKSVGFVNVTRECGFKMFFKNGKHCHTFVYVVSGSLLYDFGKAFDPITATEGMLLFVPKGLEYKADYTAAASTVKVFTFDLLNGSDSELFSKPFYIENRKIGELFGTVTRHNGINSVFVAAKLYELLWILQEMNLDVPEKYRKLLPAIQRIERNYFENVKISEYAETVGMSESNFRRLFKEYFGVSPIDYRNAIRVREAHKMVLSGECTVQEAAYLTGFNNMSFFYEAYKKQFGTGKIK